MADFSKKGRIYCPIFLDLRELSPSSFKLVRDTALKNLAICEESKIGTVLLNLYHFSREGKFEDEERQ